MSETSSPPVEPKPLVRSIGKPLIESIEFQPTESEQFGVHGTDNGAQVEKG